jgi:hypothetical protein
MPLLSTRTGPKEVVATFNGALDAAALVVLAAGVVVLAAGVGVLEPHADANSSVAATPTTRTAVVGPDMVTSDGMTA